MSEKSELGVDAFHHRFVPGQQPALLLLHGTGGDENDLLPLAAQLVPGAALLAPRGQVLEGGMPRFFRRLAEGVFDLDDLAARSRQLADWIAAARSHYELAPVHAVGYSNGANIAASMLLRGATADVAAAVLLRVTVPFEPIVVPALAGLPVLIGAGRHDAYAPAAKVERLAQLLTIAGADVRTHWSEAGHELVVEDLAAAREFLLGIRSSDRAHPEPEFGSA